MLDMTPVLLAKSDQINGPDLIGAPRVVKIAGVRLTGKEQATELAIEGDNKLWRPCKTVVRLLARAWGNDGEGWVGKRAQLFYDPDVRYGKDKPGGVRVSHLSDLAGELTVCLQVRKGVVKEYTIKPLPTQRTNTPAAANPQAASANPSADAGQPSGAASTGPSLADRLQAIIDAVNAAPDRTALVGVQKRATAALTEAQTAEPTLHALAVGAIAARNAVFDGDLGDGFGSVDA